MADMVIAAYRPKPGREAELLALVRDHVPGLRRLGLATDRPALAAIAKDGAIIEMFEWRDGGMKAAHEHPEALKLWNEFAAVCDYLPLRELAEAADLFATFTPLDF